LDERNHCKWELEAENDLAEDEKHADFVFAEDTDDENGGKNGDAARDEAANPGFETDLEEAFHDNLPGERAGDRRVLAGGEESASEEGAGEACAERRRT